MHYSDYEEKIVHRYGVELIGWTYEKLVNPSELSSSLPGLCQLLDAINTGSCKFIKLTQTQLKVVLGSPVLGPAKDRDWTEPGPIRTEKMMD